MSAENVRKVIARAVSDGSFRERLFHSPDEAFSGYDLTEQERSSILAGLSKEGFDTLSSDLGDRVSRAGVRLDEIVDGIVGMLNVDNVSCSPIPIPRPEGEEREIGVLPDPLPRPEGEIGVTPLPIPHPEDEIGVVPMPIHQPGPVPQPIPRPGSEEQGDIPDGLEAGDDGEITPINLP